MRRTDLLPAALAALAMLSGCDSTGPDTEDVGAISISASQNQTHLEVGASVQLAATVLNTTGGTMSNVPLQWTSSDVDVADVSTGGLVRALAAGETTIMARSGNVSGTIVMTVAPPECTTANIVGTIGIGDTRTGALTSADCLVPGAGPGAGWRFSATEETTLRVALSSTDFDALVIIIDMQYNLYGFDDDSGVGTDAVLFTRLPAGEYVIWAASFSEAGRGAYELEVEQIETASCTVPTGSISTGQTVTGSLAQTDCLTPFGTFADLWQFTTDATTTVQIDLRSTEFDALLLVSNDAGTFIHGDDDSGGDSNARLEVTLEPGTYTIWASSFSSGMLGAYQLSVASVSSMTVDATRTEPGAAGVIALPGTPRWETAVGWADKAGGPFRE